MLKHLNTTIKCLVVLIVFCGYLSACFTSNSNNSSQSKAATIVSIKSGTTFGLCGKDCVQELQITNTRTLYRLASNEEKYPDKFLESQINEQDWKSILDLIDINSFKELPNVSGCPDCVDNGAEWIEISFENEQPKKVTYGFLMPPTQIKTLAERLAAIRESNVNELKRRNPNEQFEARLQLYSFGKWIK